MIKFDDIRRFSEYVKAKDHEQIHAIVSVNPGILEVVPHKDLVDAYDCLLLQNLEYASAYLESVRASEREGIERVLSELELLGTPELFKTINRVVEEGDGSKI